MAADHLDIVVAETLKVPARVWRARLLAAIPGAWLLVYKGAGHAFHWEDPDQFTRDLVSFLGEEGSDPFRFLFDTVATEGRKDLGRLGPVTTALCDPGEYALCIWGAAFRFDEEGQVTTDQRGRVGRILR